MHFTLFHLLGTKSVSAMNEAVPFKSIFAYFGGFFCLIDFFNSHSAAEIGLSAPPFTLGLTKINHKNGTISPTDVGRRRRFQPWSLLDFV